ncbi:transposase [Streptomyces nodosus]
MADNKGKTGSEIDEASQVFDMLRSGMSYRETARALGISPSAVQRRVEKYKAEEIHPKAEEMREMQLAQIRAGKRAIWKRYITGDDKAVASMIRLLEREAKLAGLDSATQFKVQTEEIDPFRDRTGVLTLMGQLFRDSGKDSSQYDNELAELEQAKAEGKPLPPRRKRPLPQWVKDGGPMPGTISGSPQPMRDEFAKDRTFAAHEVQPEEVSIAEGLEEFEPVPARPEPLLNARDIQGTKKRRSATTPNPLLRDYDDD